jgi:polyferredoxin
LAALGLGCPLWLRWIYAGWMTVGLFLGHIVSTLILTGLFFLVVTPLGWVARLMGRDFLQRKKEPESDTYWQRRDAKEKRARGHYERQY